MVGVVTNEKTNRIEVKMNVANVGFQAYVFLLKVVYKKKPSIATLLTSKCRSKY